MTILRSVLLLLLAIPAFASPVITSVTPNQGTAIGGTTVVIRGTGFSDTCAICSPPFVGPPRVAFDLTEATSVRFIDSTTLEAVTPPHLPGAASVAVLQWDGDSVLANGFTFVDGQDPAFEPVLFPIFMPPVKGQFGSEFHTTARIASRGATLGLYGYDTVCTTIDPPIAPYNNFLIDEEEYVMITACSTSVGRMFYVPRGRSADLVANLRVSDVTRQAESHGVEIPVVRERELTTDKIVLLGVPVDPRFRNTLRIYGLPDEPVSVDVIVNGVTRQVSLSAGRTMFEPSYATFTDFPTSADLPGGQGTVTVVIDQMRNGIVPPKPVWAFISVTNNDTQHITTITPN